MASNLSPERKQLRKHCLRRLLIIATGALAILVLFYALENWRGERAWNAYKTALEAKGEHLDFDAFIPPPVPDEQNMLVAPVAKRWLLSTNQVTEPTLRIPETGILYSDWQDAKPTPLAEWIEYFYSDVVSNYLFQQANLIGIRPSDPLIPLIVIEESPLLDAIHTLGRQADFNVSFDRAVTKLDLPTVTIRWENVTAQEAFYTLLDNYNFAAITENSGSTNKSNRLIVVRTNNWATKQLQLKTIASTNSLLQNTKDGEVMPLVTIDAAPLNDAIKNIARIAGINFQFDQKLLAPRSILHTNCVTLRRENCTALNLLDDLLKQYGLTAVPDKSGVYRITSRIKTAGEILKEFERSEPKLQEFYAECEKPASRLASDYQSFAHGEIPLTSFNFRTCAQSLTLHASAELALSRNETALRDIKACIRLANCLTNEPGLIAQMIHIAINQLVIDPIWEGLASRRWSDGQLDELKVSLSKINLIPSLLQGLRANRAMENAIHLKRSQKLLRESLYYWDSQKEPLSRKFTRFVVPYVPRGWIYQNLIKINEDYQDTLDTVETLLPVISPRKCNETSDQLQIEQKELRNPYNFLFAELGANFTKAITAAVRNQTEINEAVIACALEQYRLRHGSFPDSLEKLSPDFLRKIPHEIVNGEKLKYQVTDDDQYVLYSVGWNDKDDGGKPDDYRNNDGDWVWRFPVRLNHR